MHTPSKVLEGPQLLQLASEILNPALHEAPTSFYRMPSTSQMLQFA